jgi:hypothetical protein
MALRPSTARSSRPFGVSPSGWVGPVAILRDLAGLKIRIGEMAAGAV